MKNSEKTVKKGSPVFLTKNENESMVVMSNGSNSSLMNQTENALDVADHQAKTDPRRMTHKEVFSTLREQLN